MIRRLLSAWIYHRELRHHRARLAEARRKHQPIRQIEAERRERLHAALKAAA